MSESKYVVIDGKNISRRWLEQHPESYPGVRRDALNGAGSEALAATKVRSVDLLVSRINRLMTEASSISAAIAKDYGQNPAMYAVNRAWHSLGTAHDELSKL